MTQQHTQIGWIGLGQMGSPMVRRLLAANIPTAIFNRSSDKTATLAEQGANVFENAQDLAKHSSAIFLMVSDFAAVKTIVADIRNELAGKVVVNMSTISPSENLQIQQMVEAAGGRFAEAPVSGSVIPATEGTLLILFGGDADLLPPLQPVFDILGKQTFHFGAVGKGSGAKLVLNSLLGIFGEAYSEAMLMAQQFGVDAAAIIDAIGGSAMNSPMFQTKKGLWAEQRFPQAFALKHAAKDLKLACTELENASLPLPLVKTAATNFQAADEAGFGEQDISGVYLHLAEQKRG